jgi:hypothetical protein
MTSNDKHKDLDLVPESVLKRRHDLDDLKRKRQHLEDLNGKKKSGGKNGSYVRKPESILAKAKQRRNEQIRYNRVKKKGMQKRASKKPIQKTKEIVEDDPTSFVFVFEMMLAIRPSVCATFSTCCD